MRPLPHPPEYYRRLHESRHRREAKLFIAPGRKLLKEALYSLPASRFHAILYDQSLPPPDLPTELRDKLHPLPRWQIERISGQETPEGVVAILIQPPLHSFPPYPPALLGEGIQDPGNLGTLLRSMEWFGYHHLWLSPESVDPFHPKVVRASMGSLFRLRVERIQEWSLLLSGYEGRCVVAAVDGTPAHQIDWEKYDSLYIGSEARGVSQAPAHWQRVSIPPSPTCQAESLNVAIAATLLLYLQREIKAGRLHTLPPLSPSEG
ncbi:MAG: RNA methyltransferase [Bacteroidia bacterium]|nr:RNA methyltransferase [Bacteroidia bacterium]MDW8015205.1 RNA methyltransferase [Bacteroidia bacterium]